MGVREIAQGKEPTQCKEGIPKEEPPMHGCQSLIGERVRLWRKALCAGCFIPNKVRKASTWGENNWHRMSEARQCERGLSARGWPAKGCQSLSRTKIFTKGGSRGSHA